MFLQYIIFSNEHAPYKDVVFDKIGSADQAVTYLVPIIFSR